MTSHSDDTPSSWYPKITPYRLVFFVTIGGLGIAKAALVSKGETASSTTVEWITGVVVALILQFLGSCEYNNACPQCWDWLFSYNLIRRSGRATRGPQSAPQSFERASRFSEYPPIVTAYRLLVSGMFAAFGLAKMLCGYLGLSTAMNTLDWLIAVPITLGLYYIGLFEENKPNLPRKLFDIEYSPQTKLAFSKVLFIALYLLGTVLFVLWIGVCSFSIQTYIKDYAALLDAQSSAWSKALEHLAIWAILIINIGVIQMSIVGLGFMLWPIIKIYGRRHVKSIPYYNALAGLVTFHALVFIILTFVFVGSLSSCVQLYQEIFKPKADSIFALLWRIMCALIATSWTAFWAVLLLLLPVIFSILAPKMRIFALA